MKQINLIKMLFPSIHPPYLAGFIATNLIFSRDYVLNKLNVSSKKKAKRKTSNCLVLPHASYGPVMEMDCSQASCLEEEN